MDIFDKLRTNKGDIGQYKKEGHGYFMFPKLEGEIGPRMKFRGKEVLNWSLNNYLGLANHPEVRETDAKSSLDYGLASPMGARILTGQSNKHEELERELAKFTHKEHALVLNAGYQGIVSSIDAITSRKDVIVYDSECHASIMDGIFLHKAKGGKSFGYLHNNIEKCEKMLQFATRLAEENGGGILLITEGVFGMAGDLSPLDKIVELKKKYNFRILLNDSHGFGTMGKTGAGTGEFLGVQNQIDLYFSTFAKSMAGFGAFLAGEEEVINYLQYNIRSQVFSKSLSTTMVIGALKRLELIQKHPELRENLWKVVNHLQNGLKLHGFDLGTTNSPVTPVYLKGGVAEATNVVMDLRENYNVFCSIAIYPVIPKGQLLLRLIPTASHSLEDVDYTIKAFSEIRKKLNEGKYSTTQIANVTA
jgi:glycine C-acetyltransferase